MRILYGVQGTGNGHITRARIMAKAFSRRDDVKVDFLFSGRPAEGYFDMEVFGGYQTRQGLTFVHQRGAIDHWQTLRQASPLVFWQDVRSLDLAAYDLVINDFEPISAWAARRQKVPCISISHQDAFRHPVPKQGDNWLNRLIMDHFAPSDVQLGVHWYHFGHPIVPPFIENEPSGETGQHILVYLPFEELQEIRLMLEPLSEVNFVCFHPNLQEDEDQGNIQWRKTCKEGFHQTLQSCRGVIANGGFELSSECLQLGKKLLIKPLHGQFEQLSNVLTLETLGLCHSMPALDSEEVENWLDSASAEPIEFPRDPHLLVNWLIGGQWQDTGEICRQLWQQVRFPAPLSRKLAAMATHTSREG